MIQQNICFDLALENLKQNGWCLWWIRSKEMMHISYTRYHCFYVYMVDFLTLKLNLYSPTQLFFCFFSFFFFTFFPLLFSLFPSFSFSYPPIYKSDFFSIGPSYNVTGVTLILPPCLEGKKFKAGKKIKEKRKREEREIK